MKKTFTFLKCSLAIAGITLFSGISFSQTVTNVAVSDFMFAPSTINITVGDTVRWTNMSGTHNIDGSAATYPSNPMAFSNPADGSSSWVFDVKFTIAGNYTYECGFHPSMIGTIVVSTSTVSVNEFETFSESLSLYPNPSNSSFTVEHGPGIESFAMYNTVGQEVKLIEGNNLGKITVESTDLEKGVYLCIVKSSTGALLHSRMVVK